MSEMPSPQDLETLIPELEKRQRIPVSTYRLQLHHGFTFQNAAAVVPYLARLGVDACYCSPYLKARPGSTHGYDICDHGRLNPEIGSEEDFKVFAARLAQAGMGQMLDTVPNHMGADARANPWWRDILENGPASPFAHFFDIDWNPIKPELKDKVLLPILGDHYGKVLDRGEIVLAYRDGALVLLYGDHILPVDPRQFPRVLAEGVEPVEGDAESLEFIAILRALREMPATTETEAHRMAERQRIKAEVRDRLASLVDASARIRRHVEARLQDINGEPGRPESFDRLHDLLESQPYRLAYWKTAAHEINYRRFFDINDLAGLRMEEPSVFDATHTLVLRLIGEGKVTGLRLDHLDGLQDPEGYLHRLQEAVLEHWVADAMGIAEPTPQWLQAVREWRQAEQARDPHGIVARPLYLLAEKILTGDESLPSSWPLHGTSGYDFLNDVTRLFVDPANGEAMRRIYERFIGRQVQLSDLVYDCKTLITWTALASELNVLAHALARISEEDRHTRDFTLNSLRETLRAVVACFPVYRTYVNAGGARDSDRHAINSALACARRRNPASERSIFNFVYDALMPDRDSLADKDYRRRLQFAMKFQQYTGPVEAKGLEDTVFYRYNRLVSLNDVGGDPGRFGAGVGPFHGANRRRMAHWPLAMVATATHDAKRGEDARARLNVLSEMPREWRRKVSRWVRINARNKCEADGETAPTRNDEYLFYQALVCAWPAEGLDEIAPEPSAQLVERLRGYMAKAVKEAKSRSSWINPNEAYERAVSEFVEATLCGPRSNRFLDAFLPFLHQVAAFGRINSLAQLVLKMVSPGVPDFYQGTELWDLSLVDPDNRRPVDYGRRERLLESLQPLLEGTSAGPEATLTELLDHWQDGRIKLFITALGLRLRRRHRRLFLEGDYLPLDVEGDCAEHVVALARRQGEKTLVAMVPRLVAGLTAGDAQKSLATCLQGTWVKVPAQLELQQPFFDLLTAKEIPTAAFGDGRAWSAGERLKTCPVALLANFDA